VTAALLLGAALVVATGSVAAEARGPGGAAGLEGPAYPGPPEPARIRYLHSLEDNAAYVKERGWWRRMLRLVAGSPAPTALVRPYGLEAGRGALWVCDPGAGVVHGFRHADSTYVRIPAEGRLESPIDVALDGRDWLHVTDSERGKVLVYTPDGKLVAEHEGEFGRPTGIAYHPGADRLYVVDTTFHRIAVQTPEGERVGTFGRRGEGEGELNFPTAIHVDGRGSLRVTDAMNFRIQTFDPDGICLGAFGRLGDGTGDFSKPKGVATDSDGNVYVVDALFEVVQVFGPDGTLRLVFGGPGRGPGEFSLPTGIAVDEEDRVYVADSYNRRVQVFRYLGEGGE
jgi:sugar lactone lactonase YvrE